MSGNPTKLQSPLRSPELYVTTHNKFGKATIDRSQPIPETIEFPEHVTRVVNVYANDEMPPDLNDDKDFNRSKDIVATGNVPIVQAGGCVVRIVDIGPGNLAMTHQTESIDYLVIVEGSIVMELDDCSETMVQQGDVVIQRATMHAWHNRSKTEWARIFAVISDIRPLKVHGKDVRENLGNGAGLFGAKHT